MDVRISFSLLSCLAVSTYHSVGCLYYTRLPRPLYLYHNFCKPTAWNSAFNKLICMLSKTCAHRNHISWMPHGMSPQWNMSQQTSELIYKTVDCKRETDEVKSCYSYQHVGEILTCDWKSEAVFVHRKYFLWGAWADAWFYLYIEKENGSNGERN